LESVARSPDARATVRTAYGRSDFLVASFSLGALTLVAVGASRVPRARVSKSRSARTTAIWIRLAFFLLVGYLGIRILLDFIPALVILALSGMIKIVDGFDVPWFGLNVVGATVLTLCVVAGVKPILTVLLAAFTPFAVHLWFQLWYAGWVGDLLWEYPHLAVLSFLSFMARTLPAFLLAAFVAVFVPFEPRDQPLVS
jgi:hypothetical protein